jgi:hypothetical protein
MLNVHKPELSSGGLRSMPYVKKYLRFAMLALLLMPISVRYISNGSLLACNSPVPPTLPFLRAQRTYPVNHKRLARL